MILLLAAQLVIEQRDYFMPDYWITVKMTAESTWTDGVDTWTGEPGCKSAGELYTGNPSCGSVSPAAPSGLSTE